MFIINVKYIQFINVKKKLYIEIHILSIKNNFGKNNF